MVHHLTFASVGRRPLWSTAAQQLLLVRSLARSGGGALLLFCVVDDHVHALFEGSRADAGRFARAANHAVRRRSGVPVGPTDLRPVDDRQHLLTLVDYVHRQPVRHALGVHPAAWAGSSWWDHVGARRLPGFDPNALRRSLPRLSTERLWESVGLPEPSSPLGDAIERLGVGGTVAACAAALACSGAGPGDRAALTDARALTVRLALAADRRPRKIAQELGVSERSVYRLRSWPLAPPVEAAATRQAAIRCVLTDAPAVEPTESESRAIRRARILAGAGRSDG